MYLVILTQLSRRNLYYYCHVTLALNCIHKRYLFTNPGHIYFFVLFVGKNLSINAHDIWNTVSFSQVYYSIIYGMEHNTMLSQHYNMCVIAGSNGQANYGVKSEILEKS